MTDLAMCRRAYADEIDALCKLKTRALVEALATVPREQFLPPGPWLVRSDNDLHGPRQTEDADPRRVYHNYSIAIDAGRQLFNATLARQATDNLAAMPWIEVRHGDGTAALDEPFDAILVNVGVTHPQDVWVDALSVNGRLILPLTATMPALGPLGKGFMTLITKSPHGSLAARALSMVMIFSAIGLRDDALNAQLGQAFRRPPFPPAFTRLRRDRHDAGPGCWLHATQFCLAVDERE